MPSQPFRFKQFSVMDDRCTHKVGTDGVLLGSWVNVQKTDNFLLDIGTGSGLIAIMLAQRTEASARIVGIEIGEEEVLQARQNIAQSPWPDKVVVWHGPVQQFPAARQYDLIVSNPPFFANSLQPPDRKRTQARHTRDLCFDDLLTSVIRLLAPAGRFAIILPDAEGGDFLKRAKAVGLYPVRKTTFRPRKHKAVERLLIEFLIRWESPQRNRDCPL